MVDKDVLTVQSQYHGCWCPGDVGSQGISSHGIDLILLECIPGSVPEGQSLCDQTPAYLIHLWVILWPMNELNTQVSENNCGINIAW